LIEGRVRDERSQGFWSADRVLQAANWTALLVLAFLAGALVTLSQVFPGRFISQAYQGGRALYDKLTLHHDVYRSDLWHPERRAERGVTQYSSARAQDGVTLYTSGHAPAAFLIGMDGTVLHEWRRPFSTVWNAEAPEASPKAPMPDEFVYFRKAYLFPNGDLLALYEAAGDTPYGYGLVKLDKNSNVLWSYLGAAHHDIDVGPDDRIYVPTHEIVNEPPSFGTLATPRLEDFLVVLGPDGKVQKKLRLSDLVAGSRFRHLLHTVSSYAVADPLHTNTAKVIRAREASRFPFGEPGHVLLSFRELGAVAVVDPLNEKLVWAARGPWIGQHDPDLLPNGNILLFDNYGNFSGEAGGSRVIEFNPRTMGIVWQYAGTADEPLDSEIRSWQQRLANGNTLIVESNGGRILEVTRSGEIVWEFINPVRHKPDTDKRPKIPIVSSAERLDPSTLDPSLLQIDAM
jgi:hypothetical protein